MIRLPPHLEQVLQQMPNAFLVGGCVRDSIFGLEPKDFDVEVFGANYEELAQSLKQWGRVDLVGRSFGVIKLTIAPGETYDFSIPRRDSKVAPGHKGFAVEFDPSISPQSAAERRDFTINAIMYDPRKRELLDFFGGEADVRARILRHTSSAFVEDPLRVLRGMQLAGRFALKAAPETIELCRTIKESYRELAIERVREEWFKWASRSTLPSAGLHFLAKTEWIDHYLELKATIGTPQDPEWHPEGDVFTHTCHCCDALVKLPGWKNADPETRIVYSLAVLTHDTAKPLTTQKVMRNGQYRIISPGHEALGIGTSNNFMESINVPEHMRKRVLPLVANHMVHFQTTTDRLVRRLSKRLEPESIKSLCLIMRADQLGRPPRPPKDPCTIEGLLKKAEEMEVHTHAPKPLLRGEHLLRHGMQPGKELGDLLKAAYEAQLEGEFNELSGAMNWLREHQEKQDSQPG